MRSLALPTGSSCVCTAEAKASKQTGTCGTPRRVVFPKRHPSGRRRRKFFISAVRESTEVDMVKKRNGLNFQQKGPVGGWPFVVNKGPRKQKKMPPLMNRFSVIYIYILVKHFMKKFYHPCEESKWGEGEPLNPPSQSGPPAA